MTVLALADHHGKSTETVAGGDKSAVILKNEDGCRAVDDVLSKLDSLNKAALTVDKRCHKLGGVDRAAGHGAEMTVSQRHILIDQLLGVVYSSDNAYSVCAEIRSYNKGKIDSDKFGKLVGKALDTPSDGVSFYHKPKEERNSMTDRSNQVNIKQFSDKVDKKRAKEFDNLTSEEKAMKRAQEKNK